MTMTRRACLECETQPVRTLKPHEELDITILEALTNQTLYCTTCFNTHFPQQENK